jgi:hypothetical protein
MIQVKTFTNAVDLNKFLKTLEKPIYSLETFFTPELGRYNYSLAYYA